MLVASKPGPLPPEAPKPNQPKVFCSFLSKKKVFLPLAAIALYALLALPPLVSHHFDISTFIVAGDRFVDAQHTASRILVHPHSDGYDGQFFYRLALDPWRFAPTAFGVRLDTPSFRMARIFYPVLAWLASFGLPRLVPAALFALNLIGLGAIAALSAAVARTARLPAAVPFAIVLWPGFIVTLMHDTAEIVACALMLAAILCHTRRRYALYAVAAALATLTRETTVPVFAGILLWDAVAAWRGEGRRAAIAAGVLLFVPFLAWRVALGVIWQAMPDSQSVGRNVGALPFAGVAQTLIDTLTGARHYASSGTKDLFVRAVVFGTTLGLAGFCILSARRVRLAWLNGGVLRPVAVSWVPLAVMLAFLKAGGPWIEPAGYLRAFSECYVVGCLVLGASGLAFPRSRVSYAGALALFALVWAYSVTQIGLRAL